MELLGCHLYLRSRICFRLLCDLVRHAWRSARTYEKWSISSIFNRLGPFAQVFEQAREYLILKLYEEKSVTIIFVPNCF